MTDETILFLASVLIWLELGGLIFLWFVDGKIKKEQALHALFAAGVSLFVVFILKDIFKVPRPFMVDHMPAIALDPTHDWSFPSAHSAVAFAIAITIWLHDKKLGSVFLIIAVFVAAGRIFANVHYPIDIIVGAIIGATVAFAVEKLHLPKASLKVR